MFGRAACTALGVASSITAACAPTSGVERTATNRAAIAGGALTFAHEWASIFAYRFTLAQVQAAIAAGSVDQIPFAKCTGAVIAPQNVMTAGHCLVSAPGTAPFRSWLVITADTTGAMVGYLTNQVDTGDFTYVVRPDFGGTHDVGFILPSLPVQKILYPDVQELGDPAGLSLDSIGRKLDGVDRSAPVAKTNNTFQVLAVTGLDFSPYMMIDPNYAEPSDSGGPIELTDSRGETPGTVVGIISHGARIQTPPPADGGARGSKVIEFDSRVDRYVCGRINAIAAAQGDVARCRYTTPGLMCGPGGIPAEAISALVDDTDHDCDVPGSVACAAAIALLDSVEPIQIASSQPQSSEPVFPVPPAGSSPGDALPPCSSADAGEEASAAEFSTP